MTKEDLKFIIAFAKVHGEQRKPVTEVIQHIQNELDVYAEYYDTSNYAYIDMFMEKYNAMNEYKLMYEVMEEIANGATFFEACREWDI